MIVKILGSGQDAGIPQIGCTCDNCKKARIDNEYRRMGPSIALLDENNNLNYIIDASPDFKHQLEMIGRETIKPNVDRKLPVNGILLTHAHFGHCSGLWYLGRESVNEKNLPIYCTSKMKHFLRNNHPFSFLVQSKNLHINEITINEELDLGGFSCRAIQVPHRGEVADTVAYAIQSKRRLLYVPDIDYWEGRILNEIKNSHVAIIDGTFYSKGEMPEYNEVPHPPVLDTIEHLKDIDCEIYFTHINHTNPINLRSSEREFVESKGFKIAYDGMTLKI